VYTRAVLNEFGCQNSKYSELATEDERILKREIGCKDSKRVSILSRDRR